jgi:hypothetical protein
MSCCYDFFYFSNRQDANNAKIFDKPPRKTLGDSLGLWRHPGTVLADDVAPWR